MTLMNKLARLSAAERRQVIKDFIAEVFDGLDADPGLRQKLRLTAPELPDEPTSEQVDAWVELAELVQDAEFRQRMRKMAEYHAGGGGAGGPAPGAGMPKGFSQKVFALAGQARQRVPRTCSGCSPLSTVIRHDASHQSQVAGRALDLGCGPGLAGLDAQLDMLASG
jgi:hypothetical protein